MKTMKNLTILSKNQLEKYSDKCLRVHFWKEYVYYIFDITKESLIEEMNNKDEPFILFDMKDYMLSMYFEGFASHIPIYYFNHRTR